MFCGLDNPNLALVAIHLWNSELRNVFFLSFFLALLCRISIVSSWNCNSCVESQHRRIVSVTREPEIATVNRSFTVKKHHLVPCFWYAADLCAALCFLSILHFIKKTTKTKQKDTRMSHNPFFLSLRVLKYLSHHRRDVL